LAPSPNPQSPIPNPRIIYYLILLKIINKKVGKINNLSNSSFNI